jgi:hypothetical protein
MEHVRFLIVLRSGPRDADGPYRCAAASDGGSVTLPPPTEPWRRQTVFPRYRFQSCAQCPAKAETAHDEMRQ